MINLYRYRSYRYDGETRLYYLNSRYYNPEWGRFINFDNYGGQVGELLSHNGYAYCKNNPVNMVDEEGEFALAITTVGLAAALKAILATAVATLATVCTLQIADSISQAVTKENNNTNKRERSKDRIGKRIKFPTRKQAEEAARKAGKGKKPILHNDGKGGRHFHPNIPMPKSPMTPHQPSPHDHYFFPIVPKSMYNKEGIGVENNELWWMQ